MKTKVAATAILLVFLSAMPFLSFATSNDTIILDFKLNFDRLNGKTFADFKQEVAFEEKDTLLGHHLECFISHSDRAIIDSIKASDSSILVMDNIDVDEHTFEISLSNIRISYQNDVILTFYYRYLDQNGEASPQYKAFKTLPLNWKRIEESSNAPWWLIILVTLAILFIILSFSTISIKIMSRRHRNRQGENMNHSPQQQSNPINDQEHEENPEKAAGTNIETEISQNPETEPAQEQVLGTNIRKSFFGFFKPKSETQQELEQQIKSLKASLKAKEQELAQKESKIDETTRLLEAAQKQIAGYAEAIQNAVTTAKTELQRQLTAKQAECERLETAKNEAVAALDKAEERAEQKFDQEKEVIENECSNKVNAAVAAKKKAEDALASAVTEAQNRFEQEKTKLEAECNEKVEKAQQAEQQAKNDAADAIANMKQQCDEVLQLWTADRDAILKKLDDNMQHLLQVVDKMNPNAFIGICGKIQSGVKKTAEKLRQHIESEAWKSKTVGECLAELRTEYCGILDYGTNSWINLLGRLYSYMSVNELKLQLSMEGLTFELVSDAFVTMQSILASLGIVVLNCSPGFDSNDSPVTASLFVQKTSIDLITSWLNGKDAVQRAIPYQGGIVYDFGQLAYFTSEDLTIHQGSVIYYNS